MKFQFSINLLKPKRHYWIFWGLVLFTAACSPSKPEGLIPTKVLPTDSSLPSITPNEMPAQHSHTETPTQTVTSTATVMMTATSTPTTARTPSRGRFDLPTLFANDLQEDWLQKEYGVEYAWNLTLEYFFRRQDNAGLFAYSDKTILPELRRELVDFYEEGYGCLMEFRLNDRGGVTTRYYCESDSVPDIKLDTTYQNVLKSYYSTEELCGLIELIGLSGYGAALPEIPGAGLMDQLDYLFGNPESYVYCSNFDETSEDYHLVAELVEVEEEARKTEVETAPSKTPTQMPTLEPLCSNIEAEIIWPENEDYLPENDWVTVQYYWESTFDFISTIFRIESTPLFAYEEGFFSGSLKRTLDQLFLDGLADGLGFFGDSDLRAEFFGEYLVLWEIENIFRENLSGWEMCLLIEEVNLLGYGRAKDFSSVIKGLAYLEDRLGKQPHEKGIVSGYCPNFDPDSPYYQTVLNLYKDAGCDPSEE